MGDPVDYNVTITSESVANTPSLSPAVIADSLLGDLSVDSFLESKINNNLLDPGEVWTSQFSRVVLPGDPDPLVNVVAATFTGNGGFSDTKMASWSTNLFQPAIDVELSADALSKIGDEIEYTIVVKNNSSADSPDLVGSVLDPYTGLPVSIELASGATTTITGKYVIPADASDPLLMAATVTVSPVGFPNVLTDSDDAATNLFQPGIFVTKTAETALSVGEVAHYTITIENTSSEDTPPLVNPSVVDSLLGNLLGLGALTESVLADGVLSYGETWTITAEREVLVTDPNPLPNTVLANFNPQGFSNVINGQASHSIAILQPNLRLVKTPDNATIRPGDTATFTMVVTNDGPGRALDVVLNDPLPVPSDGLTPLVWTVSPAVPGVLVVNQVLSANLGALAPGESRTIRVVSTIPSDYLNSAGGGGSVGGTSGAIGSKFEIDGDLVVTPSTGTIDWEAYVNPPAPPATFRRVKDLPTGSRDNSFGDGSKESTVNPVVMSGTIPNNKSDLTEFLVSTDTVNGDNFLHLAWIRANTLGTANIDFELNQSSVLSSNGVTPVRTPKDVLISFDFAASGNRVILGWREWLGTSWSTSRAFNGLAQGEINRVDVPNPFDGTVLKAQRFGEAVVNLNQAFGTNGCETFASAYAKARASDAFTSALKDFIAPVAIRISSCRSVDLPNTATTQAANHGVVSDSGLITVSNLPGVVSASSAAALPIPLTTNGKSSSITAKLSPTVAPLAKQASPSSTVPRITWTLDTNGDSIVSPLDALLVLNRLHDAADARESNDASLDVNRDGYVSAIDALLVINHLNGADDGGPADTVGVGADEAWAIDSYFRTVGEEDGAEEAELQWV